VRTFFDLLLKGGGIRGGIKRECFLIDEVEILFYKNILEKEY